MISGKSAKTSRDRFVGFAFAAAHLLLETDNAGLITFAAGARCGLVNNSLDDLIGCSLFESFPQEEQSLLRMLFKRLILKGKLELTHVVMKNISSQKFSAYLGACRLPNHPDRCFFSVSIRGHATGSTGSRRVPDLSAFLPVLESRLIAADATEIRQALSMVLIEGLEDGKTNPRLRETLEAYFLSISSDGDSAIKLANDRYAVLHNEEGALEDIRRDIGQLLSDSSAGDLANSTELWRVTVGKTELPTSDVARAIAFTLKKFATEDPKTLKISSIDNAVEHLLNSTVHRVSEVRKTVESKNFRLVYQPIVRLTSSQVHHVEALMRVGDSNSPAEFVAFAEGIGLISDLDLLVVEEALQVLRRAYSSGQNVPDIAVNISALSLGSRLFMDQFDEVVRPFGDLSRKLLIDVTELAAVNDLDILKASLIRLRKMGIRRCLGDIGSGATSFMSLNELNVDFAKIDGDVVNCAMRDGKDRTILQSIIQICSHLGTLVIAEKVETEEQRLFLRSLGVNLGQGYLFGRPSSVMPVIEAPARIRARTGE